MTQANEVWLFMSTYIKDKTTKCQMRCVKDGLAEKIMLFLAKNKRRRKANRYPFPVKSIRFTSERHWIPEKAAYLFTLIAHVRFCRVNP